MPGPSEVFIPGRKAEGASKRRWGFRLVHHALVWQSTHSRPKQTAFLQNNWAVMLDDPASVLIGQRLQDFQRPPLSFFWTTRSVQSL